MLCWFLFCLREAVLRRTWRTQTAKRKSKEQDGPTYVPRCEIATKLRGTTSVSHADLYQKSDATEETHPSYNEERNNLEGGHRPNSHTPKREQNGKKERKKETELI